MVSDSKIEIMQLDPKALVLRRPHFHLKDSQIFFMESKRPYRLLSILENEVWNALEHPETVETLRKHFPDRIDEVLRDFWSCQLCEFAETNIPESRKRVLVIEPHADDAALSLGGVLWCQRHSCEFIIATMASRSNFTSYYKLGRDYLNVRQVMEIRRKESELFARLIGGTHRDLDLTDAVLRYHDTDWTLEYFERHRISIAAATSRDVGKDERVRWTEAVRLLLLQTPSDEVWFPLGAPHTDHRLTMNACLTAFISEPSLIAGRVLRMYQDVPYAARIPSFTNEMLSALRKVGMVLDPEIIPLRDTFKQKLRLVSGYASQFKMHTMREEIETNALIHGPEYGHAELLWTVRSLPTKMYSSSGIVPESTEDRLQEKAAVAWALGNQHADWVRVLLLVPTGRWPADLLLLYEVFPRAKFEVFVAPAAAAEVKDAAGERVVVREVGSGSLAWGLLSLQLSVASAMPTIFNAGKGRLREAKWLSKLWFRGDTLVVSSVDRFVSAIESRKSQEEVTGAVVPTGEPT